MTGRLGFSPDYRSGGRLSDLRNRGSQDLHQGCGQKNEGTLSVNLNPTDICGHDVIAFRARDTVTQLDSVSLWKHTGAPEPWRYWEFVKPAPSKRLSLRKGSFYILRSKELLALPKGVAVYCRAIDESFGEMRIHYAGFVHPWFGRKRGDGQIGTPRSSSKCVVMT